MLHITNTISQQCLCPSLFPQTLLNKCKTSNDVNKIHAKLYTTGLINSQLHTTKLILNFIASPHAPLVHFARHVFFTRHAFQDPRELHDPFLWNAVVKSFSHGHEPKQAFVVLCMMVENGVCVDRFTFSLVLKACAREGMLKEGMQIHGLLWKLKCGSDLFLRNCLVGMYVRCGCLGYARRVFDRISGRDSVSYNSMIDGYVKCGMVGKARELFESMPGRMRNLITWNSMIHGYVQCEDGVEVAWRLFREMPERDLVSWNSMIDGFVKCGRLSEAQGLFERMPQRDVVTWANMINGYAKLGRVHIARSLFDRMMCKDVVACNAMMAGYVQNGFCDEALELYHDMLGEVGMIPDNATLLIILSAIAQLGCLDEGLAVHCFIEENKFSLDGKLGVALIDMYSKCGSIDGALSVFESIRERETDHWNAMINGLAIHGLGDVAFDLFMEMQKVCVKPDDITFIGLLNACAHAGLVKEGLMSFEVMRRIYKLEPKVQHYGCMVDILGRAGHTKAARKFIEDLPLEPNEVIWRTFLTACANHKNFSVGEPVAEHLVRLDLCNSSSFVLLSNMYASLGMWNEVRRIRTMMKERKFKKIPGYSRIELEGIVHEFVVQDKSHPHSTEIYSMLNSFGPPALEFTCAKH